MDVPSIWDMDKCKKFIPGSAPDMNKGGAVAFGTLVADLDRTQEQLLSELAKVTKEQLQAASGERTVEEHLVFYHAHELYHAGQLHVLRNALHKVK